MPTPAALPAPPRLTPGPLAPIGGFFLLGLALLSAARLGLVALYLPRVRAVPGALDLFAVGARMDVITCSIALFVPTPLLLLLPGRWGHRWKPLLATYFGAAFALMLFFEIATAPFLAQYDSRPNRVFLEYLVYPREVAPTVWADPTAALAIVVALVVVPLAGWMVARVMRRRLDAVGQWSFGTRLAALPVLGGLLFLGARSTLGPRAANVSTAAFSADHLVNELALNSTFSLGYAVYGARTEVDARHLYGTLPRREVLARVRRQMLRPEIAFRDQRSPLLHHQAVARPLVRPHNLVIIFEESLGAEYVGSLGGLPLTPHLDALATAGLLLTNLYSTGTRTVRGIEATVTGFPPMPGDSVVKLGLAQHDFFTLGQLLGSHGYDTAFVYGGASNFDNMRGFFLNNGFARVVDEPSFRAPVFRGTWGVSDEDLFQEANRLFASSGERPFFAVLLSTSNHPPYEYPPGHFPLLDAPANTSHNAIRYADWALGEFFRLARQEAYYDRTIFLVVADHDTRVYGADLVPIAKFHIPGLIIGPGVPAARYDGLASQIDLAPTLLGLLGLDVEHPMPGRDLLATPADVPGHALMQYDLTHAYRVGDRVVVHAPFRPARQFTYRDGHLTPAPLDPEFAADGLAYADLPAMLYHERSYRLDH